MHLIDFMGFLITSENWHSPCSGVYTSNTKPLRVIDMSSQHMTVDKAFADLKQKTGIPHKLALSGSPGYGTDTTYAAAHEYGVEDCVRFTGFVSDKSLSELYAGADLFALLVRSADGVVRDAIANRR